MPGGTAPTPIPTPVLFPFEPNGIDPIEETWDFKTDIITAHNDREQRFALRRRPTIRLKYRVTTMDPGESARLTGLLWKTIDNRWYVPLWQHGRRVTAVNTGTKVYTLDTTDLRADFSGKVLVWKDSATYDVMDYSATGAGTVTLTGAVSFVHLANQVFVMPLGIGALAQEYDLDRINIAADGVVEFELDTTSTTNVAALAPAQSFRGSELLNLHPDTDNGTEHERWVLSSERVGGDLGIFLYRPMGTSPVLARPKIWALTTKAERFQFRQWLMARRGRKVPLWVPTYQDDLTLVAPALFNASSIDVTAVNFGSLFFGSTARVKIAVLFPDRTVMPLVVSSVSIPSAGVERLNLESPTTAAIPLGVRVCFLVYARLSEDRVVLEHVNMDTTLVSLSFTELPRETPA